MTRGTTMWARIGRTGAALIRLGMRVEQLAGVPDWTGLAPAGGSCARCRGRMAVGRDEMAAMLTAASRGVPLGMLLVEADVLHQVGGV